MDPAKAKAIVIARLSNRTELDIVLALIAQAAAGTADGVPLICSPFVFVTLPRRVDANAQTDRIPETRDGKLSPDVSSTAV